MKIKINLDKTSEIVNCESFEITQKFIKLTNCTVEDMLKTKLAEKNYKLVSVISYEILEK